MRGKHSHYIFHMEKVQQMGCSNSPYGLAECENISSRMTRNHVPMHICVGHPPIGADGVTEKNRSTDPYGLVAKVSVPQWIRLSAQMGGILRFSAHMGGWVRDDALV